MAYSQEDIVKEGKAFVIKDDHGERLAEITWMVPESTNEVIIANHTWVDDSLRNQGIAGMLLDRMVQEADQAGQKIKALCPYVVRRFKEEPEKFDFINYDKQ
ncbi:MAG: GNAT family N-acetyltransferase [Aerococcus sp.]|nr:GNAT family N-acetyltransferase [Aerococcus sp.]